MAESLRAVVTAIALDHGVERIEVEQPEVFGLRQDAGELVAAKLPGEVEDGAGDRGDRDPDDQRPVGLDQVASPVPRDSLRRLVVPRHERGDVDRLRRSPTRAPTSHPAE